MKWRIVKRYNNLSPMNGVEVADYVEFVDATAVARFVAGVNSNKEVDFDIIDYERALLGQGMEILANPTGGRTGKV